MSGALELSSGQLSVEKGAGDLWLPIFRTATGLYLPTGTI